MSFTLRIYAAISVQKNTRGIEYIRKNENKVTEE